MVVHKPLRSLYVGYNWNIRVHKTIASVENETRAQYLGIQSIFE